MSGGVSRVLWGCLRYSLTKFSAVPGRNIEGPLCVWSGFGVIKLTIGTSNIVIKGKRISRFDRNRRNETCEYNIIIAK